MEIKTPTEPCICHAILPCETLMSAKQANYDKLQVSAATYLRCDGVVYNQTKEGLLLSLWVKSFKSLNIWQSYKQERCCLMHFAHLANTLLKDQLGIELKRWVRELGIWWAKRNHALRGIADPSRNRNFFWGGHTSACICTFGSEP